MICLVDFFIKIIKGLEIEVVISVGEGVGIEIEEWLGVGEGVSIVLLMKGGGDKEDEEDEEEEDDVDWNGKKWFMWLVEDLWEVLMCEWLKKSGKLDFDWGNMVLGDGLKWW